MDDMKHVIGVQYKHLGTEGSCDGVTLYIHVITVLLVMAMMACICHYHRYYMSLLVPIVSVVDNKAHNNH